MSAWIDPGARDGHGDVPHGYQLGDGHLQWRLVGLVGAPDRVIAPGGGRHFHVATQDVLDAPALGPLDETLRAVLERREVRDIEPPRVNSVPRKQPAGERVDEAQRRDVVARGSYDLDLAVTEVDGPFQRPNLGRWRSAG